MSDAAHPEDRMDPELQDLLLSADHSTKPSQVQCRSRRGPVRLVGKLCFGSALKSWLV